MENSNKNEKVESKNDSSSLVLSFSQEENDQIRRMNPVLENKIRKRKNYPNLIYLILVGASFFYLGVAWGKNSFEKKQNQPSDRVAAFVRSLSDPKDLFVGVDEGAPEKIDFSIFWQAWKEIDKKYVDEKKLDPQKRLYGAIRGMVASLGDPYSSFMDPTETEDFGTDMEGSFEGIGAELGIKDGVLTVVAPIQGMPAEKAGIRSGDKILKINGQASSDLTIDEAVKKIRGKKGTEVTLTIFRDGEEQTREIVIVRGTIEIRTVNYKKLDGDIGYIRISKFGENTTKEFNQEITKLIADGDKGLILDLRSNPGGYLNSAVEIASKFVPKGEVVVWEQSRDGSRTSLQALGGNNLQEMPLVVLIDQGSASASEILAGALRDIKKVKLIGEKSYGKGSVQQLDDLKDGSSLRITIARWLTPNGTSIHEVGIEPDVKVTFTKDDIEKNYDVQLEKAKEELGKLLK